MVFTASNALYEFWICFKDNRRDYIYDVGRALVIFLISIFCTSVIGFMVRKSAIHIVVQYQLWRIAEFLTTDIANLWRMAAQSNRFFWLWAMVCHPQLITLTGCMFYCISFSFHLLLFAVVFLSYDVMLCTLLLDFHAEKILHISRVRLIIRIWLASNEWCVMMDLC
jgi:hypothetical protein